MIEDQDPLEKALDAVRDAVASFEDPVGRTPSAVALRASSEKPGGARVTIADLGAAPFADIDELTDASEGLKRRSEEARNMPIVSIPGGPDFERRAADGGFDRAADEDE